MKNVTIKDIAKEAGVSYSTVSRVLSGSTEISPDTSERVKEICRKLKYTPNTNARSMVTRSTKLLGFIVPYINNPFTSEIGLYIDEYARKKGFDIMLGNSMGEISNERNLIKLMSGHRTDGLIICPAHKEDYDEIKPFIENVPVIFLGANLLDLPESYISVDNKKGAFEGVKYLYSLGHRNIAYLGARNGSVTHFLRKEGFLSACKEYKINSILIDNTLGATTIENGYSLAKDFFRSDYKKYTAIFASTDTNAIGVLKAAEELNVKIPEDISLLGFDDISVSSLPGIHLTTMAQPKRKMAELAVNYLTAEISEREQKVSHTLLDAKLIVRNTCARI